MIDLSPQPKPPADLASAGFVYLACPYTHADPDVQLQRMELASIVAARIMQNGFAVYSPITHGHHIAQHLPGNIVTGHDFWMAQCLPIVVKAAALIVLPMAGWRQSRGVRDEMEFARRYGLPIGIVQTIAQPWQDQLDKVLSVELAMLGAQPVMGLDRTGVVQFSGGAV